ncbi:MAG: tetratricopeptide repeat protein [bacterium]
MTRRARSAPAIVAAVLVAAGGCAHFNTLYNAELKYDQAIEIKRKADPEREKISQQEEQLYKEAFDRAARVVKYYPGSKWIDDALLLMGRASYEKGDYSTALRKFDEILSLFPNSPLVAEALLMKGRTLLETKDYVGAVESLNKAADLGGGKWRAEVLHHLGLVREREGDVDGALGAFSEVVAKHGGSEWFAGSGIEAGDLEAKRDSLGKAVLYYEKVRANGQTPEQRYLGGMRKGDTLLKLNELQRARQTFRDVAKRAVNPERRGTALLAEAGAVAAAHDTAGAVVLYRAIVAAYPRENAAAEAQFSIAQLRDASGDLAGAKDEYAKVKEQGSGHDAWQRATARIAQIQKVLDLRAKVATGGAGRDSSRFVLAEDLLESLGDVHGALAEYTQLADEAKGTPWGAKALFAEAWVLDNRLKQPQTADSVLFRLANEYAGTEVDAYARKRLGFPVWKVDKIEPPKVVFLRPGAEAKGGPAEVVIERVEPKPVPLPKGVSEVRVWVRVRMAHDGTIEDAKVVKTGGADFDQACLDAAKASRFLAPDEGGPEVNVVQYTFPPKTAEPAPPASSAPPAPTAKGAATPAGAATPPAAGSQRGFVTPPTMSDSSAALPRSTPPESTSAPSDSASAPLVPPPTIRDRHP